jgi:hypothetical protein
MSGTKTTALPDSAAELHELIGDDATATFESNPGFFDSDSTDRAGSENVEVQRDTDDTEDSEEEDDEVEDEDEDDDEDENDDEELEDEEEEEDGEDFGDGDDDEGEDDEDEVGATAIQATGSTNLRGPVVNGKASIESALEEDDDAGDEGELEDESVIEGGSDETEEGDSAETDRGIDAALRMNALVTVTAEFAANV